MLWISSSILSGKRHHFEDHVSCSAEWFLKRERWVGTKRYFMEVQYCIAWEVKIHLQSGLDVRDAAVNSLLQDVAALLQLLYRQGGSSLLEYLKSQVLPPLNLNSSSQVRYRYSAEKNHAKKGVAILNALGSVSLYTQNTIFGIKSCHYHYAVSYCVIAALSWLGSGKWIVLIQSVQRENSAPLVKSMEYKEEWKANIIPWTLQSTTANFASEISSDSLVELCSSSPNNCLWWTCLSLRHWLWCYSCIEFQLLFFLSFFSNYQSNIGLRQAIY